MFVLRCVEELPEDAIMQVDDFVGHSGRCFDGHCHESGIASLRFKPRQIRPFHLTALASNFQQAVLMNLMLDAGGKIEFMPDFEALDVFEHMPGVRFGGRLAQPRQLDVSGHCRVA